MYFPLPNQETVQAYVKDLKHGRWVCRRENIKQRVFRFIGQLIQTYTRVLYIELGRPTKGTTIFTSKSEESESQIIWMKCKDKQGEPVNNKMTTQEMLLNQCGSLWFTSGFKQVQNQYVISVKCKIMLWEQERCRTNQNDHHIFLHGYQIFVQY